ncbi:hypothetical protein FQN50_006385 [Emmonsiellopsis sp. PD_5]|nr:hypothetical protein FQN50_006385 [Emmonsiellopsis sp. PD_5]
MSALGIFKQLQCSVSTSPLPYQPEILIVTSVARDRAWFTDYTPFETRLELPSFAHHLIPVIGIGTVELLTKRSKNAHGPNARYTMRLENVLHAPSLIANILGAPIIQDYDIDTDFAHPNNAGLKGKDGKTVACFRAPAQLLELKLSGPPVGPRLGPRTLGSGGDPTFFSVSWPSSEMERWDAFRTKGGNSQADGYTEAEKRWLKTHYDGEFHFLQTQGLNIHKDEDREEGRSIVRAMMEKDSETQKKLQSKKERRAERLARSLARKSKKSKKST